MPRETARYHDNSLMGDTVFAVRKAAKKGYKRIDRNFRFCVGLTPNHPVAVNIHDAKFFRINKITRKPYGWIYWWNGQYDDNGKEIREVWPNFRQAEVEGTPFELVTRLRLTKIDDGSDRSEARINTYMEAIRQSENNHVILCAELKSPGFGSVRNAEVIKSMVEYNNRRNRIRKQSGMPEFPTYAMALVNMRNCKTKMSGWEYYGGDFAVLAHGYRKPSYIGKNTRVWGRWGRKKLPAYADQ